MRRLIITIVGIVILVVAVREAFRLQPTVYLMSTPAVMSTGEFNPFDLNPGLEKSNEIRILFATNRIPAGSKDNRTYTVFPGDKLSMGIAHMQIGKGETTWQQILNLSTSAEQGNRPALQLNELQELAQYPLDGSVHSSTSTRALADAVNRLLERSVDKNITIYAHGANTNIYRACAQAAQYHHFTGQNSVVLVFLWPSAENLLGYGTDTRHALKSAPAFARLLTLLAEHTDARSINMLAYSAGAQIVSPAMSILGRGTDEKKRKELRIGEVYYAAADIGFGTFVRHLQSYVDIPRTTTLAINRSDSVLSLSARRNRESRAGSPDRGDLSPADNQWVQNASTEPGLSIIAVNAETVSGLSARSHDFWYSHPWVSSDVLTQFIFQIRPRERGLMETQTDDRVHYWVFPPDYPERIIGIVEGAVAARPG
jgi:esterase/lipase superfamily enzyme